MTVRTPYHILYGILLYLVLVLQLGVCVDVLIDKQFFQNALVMELFSEDGDTSEELKHEMGKKHVSFTCSGKGRNNILLSTHRQHNYLVSGDHRDIITPPPE
jgi:hypothetical protein